MDFKKKSIFFPDSREYRQLSFLSFLLSRRNSTSFQSPFDSVSRRNSIGCRSPSEIVVANRIILSCRVTILVVSNRLPQSSQLIALWFCVPSQFCWFPIAFRNCRSSSPCGSVSRRNSSGFRSPSEIVAAYRLVVPCPVVILLASDRPRESLQLIAL